MHVLVVGTEGWAVDRAMRALQHAGHVVVRCPQMELSPSGCAVLDGTACDLDDRLDVVLSVRAHPLSRVMASEYGVVCALRRGVPLVLAGSAHHSPFAPWAVTSTDIDGDLVDACVRAASSGKGGRGPRPGASVDELELTVRGRAQPRQTAAVERVARPVPVEGQPVARRPPSQQRRPLEGQADLFLLRRAEDESPVRPLHRAGTDRRMVTVDAQKPPPADPAAVEHA